MCNFDHCIEYKLYFRYCLKESTKKYGKDRYMGRYKKLLKTGIFLPVIFLLGMGAGMVLSHKGISDTKNSVLAHTTTVQELRTDKIAVVNLDTGIAVGDENINYAGSLLVNLPDNFPNFM